jgi:heme-degrading monooxygenase HmoA
METSKHFNGAFAYTREMALLATLFCFTLTHCKMKTIESKDIYTLGIWTVKPGKEQEFIKEWTSFASWTSKNFSGAGKAYLLKDEKNNLRFVSFGPWDDEVIIKAWRDEREFNAFVEKMKTLCDHFEPNTLKVVSASD